MLYYLANLVLSCLLVLLDLAAFNRACTPVLFSIVILYYTQALNSCPLYMLFITGFLVGIENFIYYGNFISALGVLFIITLLLRFIKNIISFNYWSMALTISIISAFHVMLVYYFYNPSFFITHNINLTAFLLHFIIVLIILKLYKR